MLWFRFVAAMRKSIVRQIRCGLFDGQVFISIRGAHTELPLQLARKYDFLLGLRICSTPTTATTTEKWKLYFRFGIICMVDHHTLLTLCDRSIRLPAYIYICDVDACDILWSFTHSAIKCNAARINGFHFLSSRPLWLMRSISLVHCSLLTRDGAFRHFYLRSNVCLLSHVTHASLLNRQSLFFSGFIERERNYSKVRFFWLQSHTSHMYCVWCVYYSVWRTVSLLIH